MGLDGAPNREIKSAAQEFIRSILDAIELEAREPDGWEALDLDYALSLLAAGWYRAALGYADRAMTPADERSTAWKIEESASPSAMRLRQRLEQVEAIPTRADI